MSTKTLIIRTAGTNCDRETVSACERAGSTVSLLHVNRVCENPSVFAEHQILVLPGGFSYGDDIGGGKILANELRYRLGDHLKRFVGDGKLVLGICNGFQVLIKTGLLPGPFTPDAEQAATLTFNDSNKFEDRWAYLRADSDRSPYIKKGEVIYLPVAHGEGKFVPRDEATVDALRDGDQIAFRYVDADGNTGAGYPANPNGSVDDIAGISDATGRVLGLMPHPERHVLGTQHPRWTREGAKPEGDGMRIFRNAVAAFV
jgi:phosphoribosylformylglycinamidine synthase